MQPINESIRFLIAGFNCELIIENDVKLRTYFKQRYFEQKSNSHFKVQIKIKKQKAKYVITSFPIKLKAELPLTTIKEGINSVIVAFLEFNLINKSIIFLHASGFEKRKRAFLFSGKSESGKSTVLKNVPTTNKINDDVAIIRKVKKQYLAYYSSIDFGRIKRKIVNKPIVLKKIFFLEKAKKLKAEPMSFKKIFFDILNNDYLAMVGLFNLRSKKDRQFTVQNFKNYKKMIKQHSQTLLKLATLVKIEKLSFPKKFNWRDIK